MKKNKSKKIAIKTKQMIAKVLIIICLITNINTNYIVLAQDENTNTEIESAIEWLETNQNEDGTWGDSIQQITTYQVLDVLQSELDSEKSYKEGLKWAKEQEESTVDYQARRLMIKELVTKDNIEDLIKNQNEDGGFGLTDLYGSDVVDANLVLTVLLDQNEQEVDVENRLVNYILNHQNEDGSFSYFEDTTESVKLTAEVIIALNKFSNICENNSYNVQQSIRKAGDYLLSKQNDNKLWGDSLEDIRASLKAFSAVLNTEGIQESSYIEKVVSGLQLENGSVMNDAYATALYIELMKKISEIPKAEIDSINIYKKDNADKTLCKSYKAYEDMTIEVAANYDEEKAEVNVFILDEHGGVVFQDNKLKTDWEVKNQSPGQYRVVVQIIDSKSRYIISSAEENFTIEESVQVDNFETLIDCDSTMVGEPITINTKVAFDNLSNVDVNLILRTQILKGDVVVKEDSKIQELSKSKESYDVELMTFEPEVTEPATYTFKVEAIQNDNLVGSNEKEFIVYERLSNTGVYITQDKDKEKLYPGKDNLKLNFHLKGLKENDEKVMSYRSFSVLAALADESTSSFAYSGNIMSNEYIEFYLNGRGYTLGTKEGNPEYISDNNKNLLYGHPGSGTSYTTVNIDDNKYIYSPNVQGVTPDLSEGSVTSVEKIGNVKIKQKFAIVNNSNTGRNDMVEIRYIVKNEDTVSHSAGLRIMLDTMLGYNDAAPFRVPGIGALSYEKELVGDKIPQYWQAFDNLSNPSVVAQGTFYKEGMIKPDLVQFMNWSRVNSYSWYLTPTGSSTGDSAVTVFWNPTELLPGEEREYVTYYGIGELNSDISGSLVASITGASKLEATEEGYDPNPFLVTAYAYNMGLEEIGNVKARVVLPTGLKLAEEEKETHLFGNMGVGEEKQTSWNVVAEDSLVDKTLTYSVVYSVNGVDIKTINRNVFVPKQINNIAGRDVVLETVIPSSEFKINPEKVTPAPSEIIEKEDGNQLLRWNFDKIDIDEVIDLQVELNGESLISEAKYVVTKDTTLSYTNRENERETRKLKNMSVEVNKYELESEITTDKKEYTANENVIITNKTKNLHDYSMNLTGKVTIYDSNNEVVEVLDNNIESIWQGNEEKEDNYTFNTKELLMGTYKIEVQWFEGSKIIQTTDAYFNINKDGSIKHNVFVDKQQYNANDVVTYTNKISNTSINCIEKGLTLETVITNEQNEVVKNELVSLEDILSSTQVTKNGTFKLNDNKAGQYKVTATIYLDDKKISEETTLFEVISTQENLFGVKGNLKVLNSIITPAEEVSFESLIENTGNENIHNMPQIIRIIQVGTEKEMKKYQWESNVEVGNSDNKTFTWGDKSIEAGDYIIQYEAIKPNGETKLIASNNFTVKYIEDDFEKENDLWNYMGTAHRSDGGYAVLTENKNHENGAMWLKQGISLPFVTTFKYKAGGGTGADGFTFMFAKKANELGNEGREMGFNTGNGYAIEFDSFYNKFHGEQTSVNRAHIALGKDLLSTGNKGEIIDSLAMNVTEEVASKLSDDNWHDVEVRVTEDGVQLYLDGERVLVYKGKLDTTYDGFGFSSATGTENNHHYIDNVIIRENTEIALEDIKDDFTETNSKWDYLGSAYRSDEGYAVLTENKTWQTGAMWLNDVVSAPFTSKFKYKAGEGNGADGFVFMFGKESNKIGASGGTLGFSEGNGYGLEFDSFYNGSSENINNNNRHIALFKDKLTSTLKVNATDAIAAKVSDNKWHDVEVKVKTDGIEVFIDGESVMTWYGKIDKTYNGFGFAAATGDYTNSHFIDDVEIKEDVEEITENIKDDFSADTGLWNYMGTAARLEDGFARITPNENWKNGAMWLKKETTNKFTTKFKYKAGESSCGTNSDGFTYMFYKNPNQLGNTGETLGVQADSGYFIEFDSFYNGSNSEKIGKNSAHIALMKNSTSGEVLQFNNDDSITSKIADGQWHDVEVSVTSESVQVYVDSLLVIDYKGTLDTTYTGTGFSGATGGYNQNTFIDDFEIDITR
ncbi:Hypothetical protein CM240_0223 [Clostridium bornimense]|uniref:Uncharacterized protein n=1 Tax=Clostridium bornimense TaxID=1216932 RepID=W6RT26_9CLOT|nr:prenyltransferase/squalene oxidase repeat-containing protein [Clostridium bornimense]CDM67393.1 Hypothetical protein CM240_0223 [Clostridium bornimense]